MNDRRTKPAPERESSGAGEPGFGDDHDLVAWDRPETDPCQKGTRGCSVNHKPNGPEQECLPW